MVETPTRSRADPDETDERWEVFVRGDADATLRHAGTVVAPTADDAHERATRLFAWYAEDVWLCPAETVHRYVTVEDDEPDRTRSPEPRVYEETEGSPRVRDGDPDE